MGFDPVTYGAAVAKSKGLVNAAQLSRYVCQGVCLYSELRSKEETATANVDYWRLSATATSEDDVTYPIGTAFLYLGTTAPNWRVIEMGQELDDTQYYKKTETYNRTEIDAAVGAKSTVSVSDTGTATDEVNYITIDGVEKKIAGSGGGGGGTSNFDQLTNRPKYNDVTMTHETNIPKVKTDEWDAKQAAITDSNKLSSDLVDATGHTNQFVTAAEKSTWDAKASTAEATSSAAGLMSSTDKAKLDAISAQAKKVEFSTADPAAGTSSAKQVTVTNADGSTSTYKFEAGGSSIHTYRL